jgi:hypothetical protein
MGSHSWPQWQASAVAPFLDLLLPTMLDLQAALTNDTSSTPTSHPMLFMSQCCPVDTACKLGGAEMHD